MNGAWRAFAEANGAPELAEGCIGFPLFDAISGPELAMLWRDLLARVRSGVTLNLPFRCDSPGVRRYLELRVRPEPKRGIGFESVTRAVEARPAEALLAAALDESGNIRSCSWCRRFFVSDWVEVEEAVSRLRLLEDETPAVTHGMCEDCESRVRAAAGLPSRRPQIEA